MEYDGSAFSGWERQRDRRTVQETLERALARIAAQPVAVVCAGRTDDGVHATGQVAHFDTDAERPERAWVLGSNTELPDDVAVRWARPVGPAFHARFSAVRRAYRYVVLERRTRSALWRARAAWTHRTLDAARMHEAAQHLVGRHDFSAFRAAGCQARSAVRTVHSLEVRRDEDFVHVSVVADAFLQHMVRNIVGVLIAVGCGEAPSDWTAEVLRTRDRTRGGVTARPEGLYLVGVEYPEEHGLPALCPWQGLW